MKRGLMNQKDGFRYACFDKAGNYTFKVPAGVKSVNVLVVGGGGGGGGSGDFQASVRNGGCGCVIIKYKHGRQT